MTFKELLQDEIFDLPLERKDNVPFDRFIREFYEELNSKVNELEGDNLNFSNGEQVAVSNIKNRFRELTIGISNTIDIYLGGEPSRAFLTFDRAMREKKNYRSILNIRGYNTGKSFYRVRTRSESYAFSKSEMFHIPFELRGKVASQRFSIPGFPSLYLGKSLYVCWEELSRPSLESLQSVRLENKRELTVLDLVPISYEDEEDYNTYKYFMTFPIIAACSVQVWNREDTFKPEYIIPQLLLQFIRDEDYIQGVKYNSTHMPKGYEKIRGDYYNIVIPVRSSSESGHCEELEQDFNMTETISYQLYKVSHTSSPIHQGEYFRELNKRIPRIEIIQGKEMKYGETKLGELEAYLDSMDVSEIK